MSYFVPLSICLTCEIFLSWELKKKTEKQKNKRNKQLLKNMKTKKLKPYGYEMLRLFEFEHIKEDLDLEKIS